MAQQTILSNKDIANKIRSRRNELGLTIEEAASRAGVGTKTWCRYESGGSIRKDKCKGICKALNWRNLPLDADAGETTEKNLIEEYRDHKAWSEFLAEHYGLRAALSFAAGSDLMLDYIEQDLSDLAAMPKGSHIGQLNTSFIKDELPAQFLMRYTYDFLYQMKCVLVQLRKEAAAGTALIAHSVMEELIIYLCNREASAFIEIIGEADGIGADEEFDSPEDWVFDLFGDSELTYFLYSDTYLDEDHPFFFTHWNDQQFYTEL